MIRGFVSMYLPSYPKVLVYMLQSTEYQVEPYLKWFWRTKDFSNVMQRRELDETKVARMLLMVLRIGIVIQVLIALALIYLGLWQGLVGGLAFGLAIIVIYPVLWAHLLILPLLLGREFKAKPAEKRLIEKSNEIFANHKGTIIAVAGSYGKTTMKELLATVTKDYLKVAYTPANKNVSISHARFAAKLDGDEDLLIIEYGEGAPGDVSKFARYTHPNRAIITGLAPAHLDQYKTLQAAGEDIFSVAENLPDDQVYVNADSPEVKPFLTRNYRLFDEHGALGWKVSNVKISLQGTSFDLKKGSQAVKLHSGLVGSHQVGYLAFVAALSLELGLNLDQVKEGISKTQPFEHRMQPYQLGGAWIVDDTYNGNLEGIRAGTHLLKDIQAKRKIYVTPGLVDQGEESERVHKEVGELIGNAKPDLVVLMKNSVTEFIESGLKIAKFSGELRIETNPLDFYTNLNHFVASGDLVVMQNDWTDNYA